MTTPKQLNMSHWDAEKVIDGLAGQALTDVLTPIVDAAVGSPAIKRKVTQRVNQHLDWLLRPAESGSNYSATKGPVDRLVDARVHDLIDQAIHEALRRHAKVSDQPDRNGEYGLMHLRGAFLAAAQQQVDAFLASHTDIIDGVVTKFLQVLKTGKIPTAVQKEINNSMWNWFFTKLEKRFTEIFGDQED
jgi:hypothetical protein